MILMVTKRQLEAQLEEIKQALTRYNEKKPLTEDGSDSEYAGNCSYTLGWIRAIAFRD